ncbi:MAG: sensor histidine kinase [Propionibacteriaceae bacterium]|jgi:signal transduction histidine kinase|nr:sensor histidine kinase [Propionibacteriaceae bacterium]
MRSNGGWRAGSALAAVAAGLALAGLSAWSIRCTVVRARRQRAAQIDYQEYVELWVHEIKTPLAGAKLASQNAGDRAVQEALERIEGLVEQALFYARSRSHEQDYLIRAVLLGELVDGAVRNQARRLIDGGVSVVIASCDLTVMTDPQWTIFVIRQIIDNAVKYGGRQIEFRGRRQADQVALDIHDDGAGVSAQDVGRVFQKGFYGRNGRHGDRPTGLGLYLGWKICAKLGLGLSLFSPPGQGTTLTILFPAARPRPAQPSSHPGPR